MSQSVSPDATADQPANSPLAQVFQDAYQKAVLIKRLDDQIVQIVQRRKQLCDELKSIQSQLNDEFTRLVDTEPPAIGDSPSPRGVSVMVKPQAFGSRAESAVA